MSADTLRSRLREDIDREIESAGAILIEGRRVELDDLRWNQGLIAGLRAAQNLLDARYRDLYAIG